MAKRKNEQWRLSVNGMPTANCIPQIQVAYWDALGKQTDPVCYKLRLNFEDRYREITVDSLTVQGIRKQVKQVVLHPRGGKERFEAFLECLTEEPPKYINGWYFSAFGAHILPDGTCVYVLGEKILGQIRAPFEIAPEIQRMQLNVPKQNDRRDVVGLPQMMDALNEADPKVMLLFVFNVFAAIRSQLERVGITFQGVVDIVGPQNSGKTTLAKCACSWLVHTECGALIFDLASSRAAMTRLLEVYRDCVILTDDQCKSEISSIQRQRAEVVAALFRIATSDSNIAAMQSRTTIQMLKRSASLLLTGEINFQNPSEVTRSIFVPLSRKIDLQKVPAPAMWAWAMESFLGWFVRNIDRLDALVAGQNYKKILPTSIKLPMRTRANYDALSLAFELICLAALDQGAQDDDVTRWWEHYVDAVAESLAYQNHVLELAAAHTKRGNAAYVLLEGITEGAFTVCKKRKQFDVCDGLWWNGKLALKPQALETYFSKQPGYQQCKINSISKELRNCKALVINEANTLQTKISKIEQRVYLIDVEMLKESAEAFTS